MRGQPSISRVYEGGRPDEPTAAVQRQEREDCKRLAWKKHGLVVVDPEDMNDDWERQLLINIGNRLYGRRGRHG